MRRIWVLRTGAREQVARFFREFRATAARSPRTTFMLAIIPTSCPGRGRWQELMRYLVHRLPLRSIASYSDLSGEQPPPLQDSATRRGASLAGTGVFDFEKGTARSSSSVEGLITSDPIRNFDIVLCFDYRTAQRPRNPASAGWPRETLNCADYQNLSDKRSHTKYPVPRYLRPST
jgi:hypothetical protein